MCHKTIFEKLFFKHYIQGIPNFKVVLFDEYTTQTKNSFEMTWPNPMKCTPKKNV